MKTLSYGRLGPFGCISFLSFTVSLLLSVSFTTQLFLSGFTTLPPLYHLFCFQWLAIVLLDAKDQTFSRFLPNFSHVP